MASKASVKKTIKKTVTKKTAPALVSAQKKLVSKKISSKKLLTKKNILALGVIIIILVGALLYVFRGLFIAAIVNGEVISRFTLTQELDKKAGKQTLESLVTKSLILSEMKKNNIMVSDAEVNSEIKKIEESLSKQGRTLTEALSQQGLSKTDLIDQLRIQKMIEKLFAKDIIVSSKDIDEFLNKNKDSVPPGQDSATIRTSAQSQIKQQKLTTKFQAWLANLQKKAKIQRFVSF